jgi:hypothetical protein
MDRMVGEDLEAWHYGRKTETDRPSLRAVELANSNSNS